MELEGKIWKSGEFWLAEIPALDAMTQGKSRGNALFMVEDLIHEMLISYLDNQLPSNFKLTITNHKNVIRIASTHPESIQTLTTRRANANNG